MSKSDVNWISQSTFQKSAKDEILNISNDLIKDLSNQLIDAQNSFQNEKLSNEKILNELERRFIDITNENLNFYHKYQEELEKK